MRSKANHVRCLLCVLFLLVAVCTAATGRVIYVDADATSANDGSSWANGYWCLQDALADVRSGDEICVAKGTYQPDRQFVMGRSPQIVASGDQTATFQLKNGVTIKGGYAGFGEPDPDARDIIEYKTVLSGDLNGNDGPNFTNNADNSYHVVTGSETDNSAVLDGFTITAGNANGHDGNGGGMHNESGSPTLTNCTITGNRAYYGGGVWNAPESSPTIINCTFNGNYASRRGGGLFNQFFSSPTLTNCEIVGNTAGVEGSIYGEGGGMFNRDGCNPLLINCIITGNLAKGDSGGGGGGGICTWNSKIDSSQIFINCSFAGNSAPRGNSLSYDSLGKDFPSTVQLTNCILWDSGNKIWNNDDSTVAITFSNVQGLTGGRPGLLAGNINEDPLFVDADGVDDVIGTEDDDLRLFRGSPCIDAGDNSAIPQSVVVDLDGNPRIINGIVDMGAYEAGMAPTANVYYVDAVNGDNSNDGLSLETAFATIQKGIDSAEDSDTVLVYPGLYTEEINFLGKAVTVQSAAGAAVLNNPDDFAVSFYYGEGPGSILKNFIIRDSFMGIFIAGSSPTVRNVTVVDNKYGIEAYAGAKPDISNIILWNNTDGDLFGCRTRYSCIERGDEGDGNIDADPLFVDPDSGDYHLRSGRGRYWPEHDVWVLDKVTSLCVDGGEPTADYSGEPMPNGGRINMGAYGGTDYASMSEMPSGLNYPPVVTIKSPEDGAEYWGHVPIEAYAWDVDGVVVKVEFFVNGGKIGEDNDGSDGWAIEWSDYIVDEYELFARATDNDGASTDSTAIRLTPPQPKGRGCFTGETGVWVDGALVPISKVGLGRNVGCIVDAGVWVSAVQARPLGKVEKVQEHEGIFVCYDVLLESGNCISVAECHYFLTESGRWVALQNLKTGTKLQTAKGSIGIISVNKRPMPYVGKIYNLKVEGSDSYLVGKDAVIVRDY